MQLTFLRCAFSHSVQGWLDILAQCVNLQQCWIDIQELRWHPIPPISVVLPSLTLLLLNIDGIPLLESFFDSLTSPALIDLRVTSDETFLFSEGSEALGNLPERSSATLKQFYLINALMDDDHLILCLEYMPHLEELHFDLFESFADDPGTSYFTPLVFAFLTYNLDLDIDMPSELLVPKLQSFGIRGGLHYSSSDVVGMVESRWRLVNVGTGKHGRDSQTRGVA